jgi:Tfp pilus assembly major pilin PilA
MSSLSDIATKLYELRERKAEVNNTLKDIQSELNSTEEELLEEMGHEGMTRLDLADCGSFHIATRKFYKIADRELLMDFIHEEGDVDLLTVNHHTLNAYAKEMYARKEQEGVADFNMPGIEFTTKTQIRVRKARS